MVTQQTQWIVIAGAPSSGKTTTVHGLHKHNIRIIPEAPRTIVEYDLMMGKTLEEIRGDTKLFQDRVISIAKKRENNLNPEEQLVLDIALPSNLIYSMLHKADHVEEVFQECRKRRYRHVFILDRLPVEYDHVRTENQRMMEFIDRKHDDIYRELGYSPIRVPMMNMEDRVSFILDQIGHTNKQALFKAEEELLVSA